MLLQLLLPPLHCGVLLPRLHCEVLLPPLHCGVLLPRLHCGVLLPPLHCGVLLPPLHCGALLPPLHCGILLPPLHCEVLLPPLHCGVLLSPLVLHPPLHCGMMYCDHINGHGWSDIPLSVPDNLVTVTKSREALKQFRLLYNNEAATFRSPELKAAIENVLYTSNDILAVLPTAVVIVPIVSLVDDTMRQAASHGLSLTNNVSNIHNKRLIVTPEATVTQCFKDCLMQIYVQKKLGTIFVDEVHFYTLQSQLRPTFRQLPKLWFLPVPMVLRQQQLLST
ncbi:hypothetical protein EMCRGX_G021065 [Ephydatia muelleri]|eukprot:Em0016g975a